MATRINSKDLLSLCDWLRQNQSRLTKERPTRNQVAEQVNTELQIEATWGAIRQAQIATGITWSPKREKIDDNKHTPYSRLVSKVDEIQSQLGDLQEVVLGMAETLKELLKKFPS